MTRPCWLRSKLLLLLLAVLCNLQHAVCRPHPGRCLGRLLLRGQQTPGPPAGTAYVANASDPAAAGIRVPTVTLPQALADPRVTTVMLMTNYSADEFIDHTDQQINLERNVTLTAPNGLMPLLDFQFVRSAVHLCATCVFHMRHISIANERRGNGAAIDFFVGVPGSVVKLEDALRLRLACTTTDSTMELIQREQPRSQKFPLPDSTQRQVLSTHNVTYLGNNYTDMLWLIDYSYDVPPSFQEGKGIIGGFNMRTVNTTRLCRTTINANCLKVKGPDVCVNEAIDALLASEGKHPDGQQAQAGQKAGGPWLVAVVVPIVVVAGLLAAASVALWVLCMKHRRQRDEAALYRKSQSFGSGGRGPGSSGSKLLGGGPGSTGSSGRDRGSGEGSGEEGGSADPFLVDDLGPQLDQGWEVVAVGTSPSIGAVGNAKIHFGRLIGAGSFGRVYKGRWAGREVAIKCIEHDTESNKAVDNEVRLMLATDHPNVVKAFHYVTYRHALCINGSSEPAPAAAPAGSAGSHDSGQAVVPAAPAASPAWAAAANGRQPLAQQRQLYQLEQQLKGELGPRQQLLLDMHLGFAGGPGSGVNGSTPTSVDSQCGLVPTAVSSSPAATSVSADLRVSRQSTSTDSFSQALAGSEEQGHDSSDACLTPGAVASPQAAAAAAQAGGEQVPALAVQQSPSQACNPSSASALVAAELQGLLQRQLASDASTPEQKQQWQQVLQQLSQQEQALSVLPARQGMLQQQQEPGRVVVLDQPSDGGWGASRPVSPPSLHTSAHSDSQCSYPSTGQALTPNQKMQLQRYLMRQQHLLQTSGMRVRPQASLTHSLPAVNSGRGQPDSSNGSNGSDTAGQLQSSGGSKARTPRQHQDQRRARTYIVQEFCDLGTFTSYASKVLKDPADNEQMMQLLVLLLDAARGIAALHSKSVVHGDVNARNVLVSSSSAAPYGAVAKLADLGLSRVIRQQATHKTTNTVGTLSHAPPEMLRHGHMSAAVDIYSFGIMMWEVFTAQPAFKHLHYGQFFECIVLQNMRPNIPEDMPRDYSLLMLSCWATNPADRPSAEQLLELLQMMLGERQELQEELLLGGGARAGGGPGLGPGRHGMLEGVGDEVERAGAEGVVGAQGVEWQRMD